MIEHKSKRSQEGNNPQSLKDPIKTAHLNLDFSTARTYTHEQFQERKKNFVTTSNIIRRWENISLAKKATTNFTTNPPIKLPLRDSHKEAQEWLKKQQHLALVAI